MDEFARAHDMADKAFRKPNNLENVYQTADGRLYEMSDTVAQFVGMSDEQIDTDEKAKAMLKRLATPQTENTLVEMARQTAPDTEDKISEDVLQYDTTFVRSARDVYALFEGKQFTGDAEEAVQYGMDVMGEFAFNFFGVPGVQMAEPESGFAGGGTLAQAATLVGSGTPEQAKGFLYMLSQYERLPNFTQAGMARMFRGLVNDPTTTLSVASMGVPSVLKAIGQDAASMGVRKALQTIAANPARYGAIAGFGYATGGEAALMDVERASGKEVTPAEEALRFGISGPIGATAGAVIGKGADVLMPALGDAISAAGTGAKQRMAEGAQLTSGVDIDPILAAAGDVVDTLRAEDVAPQSHPGRISTRQPSATAVSKGLAPDPIENNLIIGLEESIASGEKPFNHNVDTFRASPNMTLEEAKLSPADAAEAYINHLKENLLWLHDKVKEKTRARSKLWYDGARALTTRWSNEYDVADASVAGILAALSPQKDWYQNVSLAKRVLDILTTKTNVPFDKKMEAKAVEVFPGKQGLIKLLKGKTLDQLKTTEEKALWLRFYDEVYNSKEYPLLTPEGDFGKIVMNDDGITTADVAWGTMNSIQKAINSFYSNGDRATLSGLMGERHKVRNFYNNILDPNGIYGDVTIDTHAVAAATLRPLSASSYDVFRAFGTAPTKEQQAKLNVKEGADWVPAKHSAVTGQKGTYGFYAEAYRRAAAERGVLPREMQSITWEAVRGLFSPTFKGDEKNVKMIRSIWESYRKGEKTIDEVRNEIEKAADYITPPTWE